MRCLLILVFLTLSSANRVDASDAPMTDREQVVAARAILEPWQSTHAQPVERELHIVCWTPSDRDFPADYQGRLTRILKDIQRFYADEMDRHGFGPLSFNLQLDAEQQVVVHTVRGAHPVADYGRPSGDAIRDECRPVLKAAGIDFQQETVAIFCNLATWDEKNHRFSHNSPYYASGNYRKGTAWQVDSPELDVPNMRLKQPMIQDGEYGRISLGKHNSIFIGGMAHELGHTLGLPHCAPRPDEAVRGTPLMGSGNRTYGQELRGEGPGTFLSLAHALRLASHPQFCDALEREENESRLSMEDLEIHADGRAITVTGVVHGEPPVYAVVAYFDPEGHQDYDSTTATCVPGADGRFTLRSDALVPGKGGQLRILPLHANGAIDGDTERAKLRFAYRVNADGTPDLQTIETRQLLKPILQALAKGDQTRARGLARQLKMEPAAAIAAELVDPQATVESPAQYRGRADSQPLTQFQPTAVSVGWAKPTRNRIPDPSVLLESNGVIYQTGLYAHAPARHAYDLGGDWQTLTGKAGLADGHRGSVRFEIHGDGRELWKSATVGPDETMEFEVDVRGIKQLELLTFPTDDGPGADWGLWLEPRLSRAGKPRNR